MIVSVTTRDIKSPDYVIETAEGVRLFFKAWDYCQEIGQLTLFGQLGFVVATLWGDDAKLTIDKIICVAQ